jgi:CHAT domain-containing protein
MAFDDKVNEKRLVRGFKGRLASLTLRGALWRKPGTAVLGLALVLAGFIGAAGAAAASAGDEDESEESLTETMGCLPADARPSADSVALRLAGARITGNLDDARAGYTERIFGGGKPGERDALVKDSAAARLLLGAPSKLAAMLLDGSADVTAGRYESAERQLRECQRVATAERESLAAAVCANNLGVSYALQGRLAQSRTELQRALQQYETRREPPAQLPDPRGGGVPGAAEAIAQMAASALGRLPPELRAQFEASMAESKTTTATALREAAVKIWRSTERLETLRGLERSGLNLGNVALAGGQLAEAQAALEKAYGVAAAFKLSHCKEAAAADLARLYRALRRDADAQKLLQAPRAKAKTQEENFSLLEFGVVRLALAGLAGPVSPAAVAVQPAVAPLPAGAATAGNSRAGGKRQDDSTVLMPSTFDNIAGRTGAPALAQLLDEATRATQAGPGDLALRAWKRLALRAEAAVRPDLGFAAHAALMRLYSAQGRAAAAVWHGKRAANLAQSTRMALVDATPSRDARRAFLRDRRQVYVQLAQLLLDQQRLAEAENVLQILKEDEGQQFSDAGARGDLGMLQPTSAEARQQQADALAAQQLQLADAKRRDAAATLPLAGNAMLFIDPPKLETARLKFGLSLQKLPAALRAEPTTGFGAGPGGQQRLNDMKDFYLGPGKRLESLVLQLIEDAPKFTQPATAAERATLAETLKRLPQLQAELAPLLAQLRAEGPAFTVTTGVAGRKQQEEDKPNAAQFMFAEATAAIWRAGSDSEAAENRHLQRDEATDLAAAATAAATGAPPPPRDDTLPLLAAQPVPTALLYYLPGDERLDVLLVSAQGRQHFRLALTRAQLDEEVERFLAVLDSDNTDPRQQAHALYERLFAPVAQAVAQTRARVLALSLSERLRFMPFAALHDGQGWLVERYALALHPGGKLAGRLKSASPNWRVAAFGATQGAAAFRPLPNVRNEINALVRPAGASTGGVLPGQGWLDADFTAERLRAALGGGAQLLHIASHFKLQPQDAQGSFLLLGDGSQLSLRELAGPAYRFDRIEMVTLSACQTAVGGQDTRYRQEIDGLAALLMGQGAPSVLASLWLVNDASTATLMSALYRLRESQKLSRALALQQSQLAMIRAAGRQPSVDASEPEAGRVTTIRPPGAAGPAPAPALASGRAGLAGSALGMGHPYYWAPFVLMGNWL